MTRDRSDLDLGGILGAWMNDAAPASIPVVVLEEAFARTMAAPQARIYPWQRLARRSSHPRRLTLLSVAVAALLVGVLGFGVVRRWLRHRTGSEPHPVTDRDPEPHPVPTASPSPSPFPATPIVPTASVAVVKPQSLSTDGKVVWVLSETGSVARIDPATNTLGTGVQTGATDDFYQGMSVGANGVWVTEWNNAKLYRVDPTSLKLVATIPVGLAPKGVLATDTAVWVADTHDGKVYRIDPETNKIVATITVGPTGTSGPNWFGSGLGSIWVDIPNNQTVVRIDAVTNAIQATIRIPDVVTPCGGFAVTPTAVWNTSCDGPQGMTRIDPVTNTVVTAVKLDQQGYNPSVINGVPWASIYTGDGNAGRLGRISSATNAVDLELAPGPTFGGGGDLVVAAGSAWVIDGGNDRVLRLPLAGFPPS